MSTPETVVDHLLLGVAGLERGVEWIEDLTGVRALPGGSHPGVGTRNALLALAGRRYLEIIAPDPAQATYAFPVDIRDFKQPRLVAWAVAMSLDRVLEVARKAGHSASGPQSGSRARLDGKVLKWRVVRLQNPFDCDGIQPLPFFIEWAEESVHPSADSPTGCNLISLKIGHPDAADLAAVLGRFGIDAEVRPAGAAALTAVLTTPKGELELK